MVPTIADSPEVEEKGGRPTADELTIAEACVYTARSASTIQRALGSGTLLSRKWMGLLFIHRDVLDALYAPGVLERRRQRAQEKQAAENGVEPFAYRSSPPPTPHAPGYSR